MQTPFIFIDFGSGWQSVTSSLNDVAALSNLTVRWGTDSPATQPEPGVMSFTLRDRTGSFAGAAMDFAGAHVLVQLSEQPTWDMLTDDFGTWEQHDETLTNLYSRFTPASPDTPDSAATTIFDGIISNGGKITKKQNGVWLIELSATSRMLLWKRMATQGPTGTGLYDGQHWAGTPQARFAELNKRASAVAAPLAEATGLDYPPSVASYGADSFPTQLDLLHKLFAHSSRLPLWFEVPERDHSKLVPLFLSDSSPLNASSDGLLYITVDGEQRAAFDGSTIIAEQTLEIPEPITQIVVNSKKAKVSDGKIEWEDATLQFTSTDLPANLTATQSSATLDSDAVTANDSPDQWKETTFQPTAADRATFAEYLLTFNMRLKPPTVKIDSRYVDSVAFPWLFWTAPSGAMLFVNTALSNLTGSDGHPAFSGVFTSIGGTLSFLYINNQPVLRHELTLTPLPADTSNEPTWDELTGWPVTWEQTQMTLAELSTVSVFDKTTPLRSMKK